MLPTAPLPNTRLTVEDFPQPVRASTKIMDVLSEFIPGQKLVAQIQFQLANGAYRATIAQRDVTLALPFSAKPGDSLELDVVETEGRIAFAVSRSPTEAGKEATNQQASANTTLSRTGQLIGELLRDRDADQQKPAPLNAGEPVLKSPPTSGKEIAPALQQAISRSGLFYESHQAAWVNGKLPETALRQEPQGQLQARANPQNISPNATLLIGTAPATASPLANPAGSPQMAGVFMSALAAQEKTIPGSLETATGPTSLNKATGSNHEQIAITDRGKAVAFTQASESASVTTRAASGLPTDLAPLVQQQLASLANNVYPFQGAIWPGQQILWEIVDEDGHHDSPESGEPPRQWKTRLKLLLPSLGDIDATIQLDGNDISLQMKSSEAGTQSKLKGGIEGLRSRLELAGLRLTGLDVMGYGSDEPAH